MKKATFFKKLLSIMFLACGLTACLSGIIYSVTGIQMTANRIAKEMVPRAFSIARLATRYLNGQVQFDSFADFAVREQKDSNIYVFDSQGNIVIYSDSQDAEACIDAISAMVPAVFSENEAVVSTKWRTPAGIVVGVPITDNMGRATGAVFISRPRSQVQDSMRSLVLSLVTSCIASLAVLMIPAYFVSRRFSNPIKEMTKLALSMSGGDFSLRAGDNSTYELSMLGGALNELSGTLNTTIQELILSKDRLHTILHGLTEGVIALDHAGAITYYNPAAAELLGCGEETAAVVAAIEPFKALISSAVETGKQASMQHQTERNILAITASPSRERADDSEMGSVLLLQDVSEYERLEQTRRDYVANVSHELRTPIASIRSLAEALNDGLIKTDDDRSRYYSYILRESMRLSRLINDLLELSRLQSGAVALEKQAFSLEDLIGDVTERMRIPASDSGIELVYEHKPLPKAFSNRDRVEQVLVALVDNAVKYAVDDGTVTVSAKAVGERIAVSVRNTGHIDDRDLPHIFDRFYKADASHSEGGTGLGLAITKELLLRLGESIEARNDGQDAVMTFTVACAEKGGDEIGALNP